MIKELSNLAPSFSYMNFDLLQLTLNSISELLCQDLSLTFVLLFDLLKQCFGRLKKALVRRTPKVVSKLYGFRVLFTLKLVVKLLHSAAKIKNGLHTMGQLRYPVIELVFGLLELSPQPKYYPLFLHFLQILLDVGQVLKVRVPVMGWVQRIFDCNSLKNPVRNGSNVKGFDFEVKLRADAHSLKSNFFWTDLVRHLMYLLMKEGQNNLHRGRHLFIFYTERQSVCSLFGIELESSVLILRIWERVLSFSAQVFENSA